jgi:hypothetical protein
MVTYKSTVRTVNRRQYSGTCCFAFSIVKTPMQKMFGQEHTEDDEAYVSAPWEIMNWKEGYSLILPQHSTWKGWVSCVAGAQDINNFKYLQTHLSALFNRGVSQNRLHFNVDTCWRTFRITDASYPSGSGRRLKYFQLQRTKLN